MADAIIKVEGLGKRYHLGIRRHDTLRDRLAHAMRAPLNRWRGLSDPDPSEFWALRDINFEVQPGEVLGIIGRNGAGKSTLLKVLSRITEPTTGRVSIRGRVASLLEVGTGFHPELTGRENIFLNGAILGMSRAEIRRKFDEIVAFAEVEKFIDTSVKHYSSGMYVRLAFAVAAHLEPEILVVDEVLAVGDIQFQQKCLGKMQSVAASDGRTVLFVSHNTAAVAQLCSRGLLLDRGSVGCWSTVQECLTRYTTAGPAAEVTLVDAFEIMDPRVAVADATVNGKRTRNVNLTRGTPLLIDVWLSVSEPISVSIEARLLDQFGGCIAFFCPGHSDPVQNTLSLSVGRHRVVAQIDLPALHRGIYEVDLAIVRSGVTYYARARSFCSLRHEGTPVASGAVFEQSPQGAGYATLGGRCRSAPDAV